MAVVIRLSRHGRHKLPFYRIVVADSEMKRDGRHLEAIGTMNPLTNPSTFDILEDRVRYWVGVGAKPSDTVAQLIERKIPGFLGELEKGRLERIRSKRAKRKARAKGKGGETKAAAKTAKPKKAAAPKAEKSA